MSVLQGVHKHWWQGLAIVLSSLRGSLVSVALEDVSYVCGPMYHCVGLLVFCTFQETQDHIHMKHPPRPLKQGTPAERDDNTIARPCHQCLCTPWSTLIFTLCYAITDLYLLYICYISAFLHSKQGMMRRDLYINSPHTNLQNPLNRCRNLMMAISGQNMQFH